MNKIHVKTGDIVKVIVGRDRGKEGKVLQVSPEDNKIIVEKINMVKKHVKPRKQGQQGGIVDAEAPLYASKVMIVCPKCKQATRVGNTIEKDKKLRVCKKCSATF